MCDNCFELGDFGCTQNCHCALRPPSNFGRRGRQLNVARAHRSFECMHFTADWGNYDVERSTTTPRYVKVNRTAVHTFKWSSFDGCLSPFLCDLLISNLWPLLLVHTTRGYITLMPFSALAKASTAVVGGSCGGHFELGGLVAGRAAGRFIRMWAFCTLSLSSSLTHSLSRSLRLRHTGDGSDGGSCCSSSRTEEGKSEQRQEQ